MTPDELMPAWAESLPCAITVTDATGRILAMNRRSRDTFEPGRGAIVGHNLSEYHKPESMQIIERLLATGGQNAYTVEKRGVRKLVYQSAWREADGSVGGLVEISTVMPEGMPHRVRD